MTRNDDTPITLDLFADESPATPGQIEQIGQQAFVLRGFALPWLEQLLPALETVLQTAPFRQMVTPGGFTMSVALSSCGALGWTTDRCGYRYTAHDPQSGRPWPDMPTLFRELAQAAARAAHFEHFEPDACLINRYVPGARMSLHQDKNERSLTAPIVSISLGLPAVFQFGGFERSDKPLRVPLFHGDIVVWGGVDRLRYHGVLPLKDGRHPRLGAQRINLTFRTAG
ncbi:MULTISPECIES: DNA oxidative demethylase AlkB [unclassified Pseudomonas]|uniref:DNA oxidative demethylase AlkB n=1 Tax=unclassified Pseudomonas TaxID=196821 RepID=UPI001199D87F|nr:MULTISPECIES: DNA oxidative demethylase AlkB [unclassified Pseudomonas]TWC17594.1 DNA-N1-methyladenine dioxygenase [Pseudomonas sp. SJZ074]TWC19722.1 DNA-N1-methyladenine dioxygenase [Pseudomonas sp. SJZ075]TWC35378.1 DNA-N1-methyladenine dioxygenase [Pseudomonas sp. SJZ078]TWC35496.1 DNA-N1-methyladenine dioxygenase [Pseudomonas sp. SJZ085]TWC56324.1 DNA-N1-methyladenine dioxygenase [Pseudomonas sp. SJZ124]